VIGFTTLLFMQEPEGTITEVREDGTVELIKVGH
jgi:NNP family nitrate/nitrite transporter-like MFS transporter